MSTDLKAAAFWADKMSQHKCKSLKKQDLIDCMYEITLLFIPAADNKTPTPESTSLLSRGSTDSAAAQEAWSLQITWRLTVISETSKFNKFVWDRNSEGKSRRWICEFKRGLRQILVFFHTVKEKTAEPFKNVENRQQVDTKLWGCDAVLETASTYNIVNWMKSSKEETDLKTEFWKTSSVPLVNLTHLVQIRVSSD